jgi:hypothetical protein
VLFTASKCVDICWNCFTFTISAPRSDVSINYIWIIDTMAKVRLDPQVFYDRMNLESSIVIQKLILPNILDLANCIACYSCIWLYHGFELQVLSSKFRDVLQANKALKA